MTPNETLPKPSAAFKVWKMRLNDYENGGTVRESLIVAMRSMLRRCSFIQPDANRADAIHLVRTGTEYRPSTPNRWKITQEQSEKGITWLRRREIQKLMDVADRAMVDNFSHFLFVGLTPRNSGFVTEYLPVYRVVARDGKWFDYCSSPWQGGKNRFEILCYGCAEEVK